MTSNLGVVQPSTTRMLTLIQLLELDDSCLTTWLFEESNAMNHCIVIVDLYTLHLYIFLPWDTEWSAQCYVMKYVVYGYTYF